MSAQTSELALRPSQLHRLLKSAIRAREPVMVSGGPGLGKTEIAQAAAAEEKAEFLSLYPVTSDPTDFKGVPAVVGDVAQFFLPADLAPLFVADGPTLVVMFDDFGQAPAAVQAAAMHLPLARTIGGRRIADRVTFLAASNRRGDRADVRILEPVKGRFTCVELRSDVADWTSWANAAGIAPEVVSFFNLRPGLLSDFKPSADFDVSPSPRGWARLARWVERGISADLQLPCFAGCVGQAAAGEFLAFLRVWQTMPQPDEIFAAPGRAKVPSEPSTLWALTGALSAYVRDATMAAYRVYLERLCAAHASEYAIAAIVALKQRQPRLMCHPEFGRLAAGPIGRAMGLNV